jgi:hypothetical protein
MPTLLPTPLLSPADRSAAQVAGLLYLVIIVCGIGAEVVLRGPLVDLSSAGGTALAIREAAMSFRLAIGADIVMAMADAALAILLYVLFRPVAPVLALTAMVFRLVQSVLIGANLMNMQAAWLLISGGQDISALTSGEAEAMATLFLNMHAHGYDLGLVFFGVNSLLTGALIWRSGFVPRILGAGIALAGMVYLTGSTLRFFAPAAFDVFSPAYGITLITEAAFCLWLLLAGWSPRAVDRTA